MTNRETIQKQLETLKELYINILIYSAISVVCIIIWISMGFGPFWPIWVMLSFSVAAFIQAIRAGQLPKMLEYIPFLKPEWENAQIERLLQDAEDHTGILPKSKTKKNHSTLQKVDSDSDNDTIHA